ncbi:MAG: IS200/IS605 family transposase [bacterium]
MSQIRIWIHLIWSTKNREKLISPTIKPVLLKHIRENAKSKDIYLDFINCIEDHIHLLISLPPDQTIGKIVQLLKGESSYWMNQQKLRVGKFEWQDDYMAVSVSQSMIDKVREYIKNQEEHHRKKTFLEEYEELMKLYSFSIVNKSD